MRLLARLKQLGAGFITGAADDDPSAIGTYAQVGAQFGMAMLWLPLFSYPLMVAAQLISARVGRVTGHGLAHNMRTYYPAWMLRVTVLLLLFANTINLAADLGAMGQALQLLVGGHPAVYALGFGVLCTLLQVLLPYPKFVPFLKWLTPALLAYVVTVFFVPVPWAEALHRSLVPTFSLTPQFVLGVTAVLGTTISPYLFFWQASLEAEEQRAAPGEAPLRQAPQQARAQLTRTAADTWLGMGISNLVAYFIILAAAVTLHMRGIDDIQTSAQAAEALRPVAGDFAFWLFSAGIIGTGMLGVPVLAGSAAYAVAETLRWRTGLRARWWRAKGFYGVLAIATIAGTALNLTPLDPIRALFWSSVINGVFAAPILVMVLIMAADRAVMGRFTLKRRLKLLGWLSALVMALAAVAFIWNWRYAT